MRNGNGESPWLLVGSCGRTSIHVSCPNQMHSSSTNRIRRRIPPFLPQSNRIVAITLCASEQAASQRHSDEEYLLQLRGVVAKLARECVKTAAKSPAHDSAEQENKPKKEFPQQKDKKTRVRMKQQLNHKARRLRKYKKRLTNEWFVVVRPNRYTRKARNKQIKMARARLAAEKVTEARKEREIMAVEHAFWKVIIEAAAKDATQVLATQTPLFGGMFKALDNVISWKRFCTHQTV